MTDNTDFPTVPTVELHVLVHPDLSVEYCENMLAVRQRREAWRDANPLDDDTKQAWANSGITGAVAKVRVTDEHALGISIFAAETEDEG